MTDSELLKAIAQIQQSAHLANEPPKSFRGQLYGPSGGGKTVIAAMIMRNLVRDGIILDIDTSEGYVSWANHPGLSDGIMVIPFTTIEDLNSMADAIKQKIPPFDQVRGIIFDEGSKMAEQDAIRVNRKRQTGFYGDKMKQTAEQVAQGPDYQIALERWREMLFKTFDNRDVHVIVTSHVNEKKDKNGAIIGIAPAFSPKINQATKEYLHLSAYLVGTVTNDPQNPGTPLYTRRAQVHPTMMVDAKSRTDIRSISVDADDLPMLIFNWMNSGKKPEDAPDVRQPDEPHQETLTTGVTGELAKEDEITQQADFDLSETQLDTEGTPELDFGLDTIK